MEITDMTMLYNRVEFYRYRPPSIRIVLVSRKTQDKSSFLTLDLRHRALRQNYSHVESCAGKINVDPRTADPIQMLQRYGAQRTDYGIPLCNSRYIIMRVHFRLH